MGGLVDGVLHRPAGRRRRGGQGKVRTASSTLAPRPIAAPSPLPPRPQNTHQSSTRFRPPRAHRFRALSGGGCCGRPGGGGGEEAPRVVFGLPAGRTAAVRRLPSRHALALSCALVQQQRVVDCPQPGRRWPGSPRIVWWWTAGEIRPCGGADLPTELAAAAAAGGGGRGGGGGGRGTAKALCVMMRTALRLALSLMISIGPPAKVCVWLAKGWRRKGGSRRRRSRRRSSRNLEVPWPVVAESEERGERSSTARLP